jgi:hypothetical protein
VKKQFPFAIGLILVFASICLAQETTPAPKPAPKPRAAMGKADMQKNLIATEKKLWDAWKNKDVKPFKSMLSADVVSVSEMGVQGKEATINSIASSDCEVRSYELADFKVTKFDSNAAMLTYKASQDATCGGKTVPPTVWASSLYVRRGGKWYAASHQETAVTP